MIMDGDAVRIVTVFVLVALWLMLPDDDKLD